MMGGAKRSILKDVVANGLANGGEDENMKSIRGKLHKHPYKISRENRKT